MKFKMRKGDLVEVIAGKDKGKQGKIRELLVKENRVVVDGVNRVKRHTKPSQKSPQGGIFEKEAPIHASNVMLVDPDSSSPTRVGYTVNADGTKTMHMVRLKVQNGAITEIETIKCNQGEADRLWDPDRILKEPPANFQLSIREPERDSYYDLIGAAESYWRAFQTNGTPNYRRARLLPDSRRFENGVQTTGVVRDGVFNDTSKGFDEGRFIGRNIWDRRYPVVDEERGVVLSIVRFGRGEGKSRGCNVIAVAGTTGGVGSTSIAVNLANCLASSSANSVALIDLDLALGDGSLNGIELGLALRSLRPALPLVIFSAYAPPRPEDVLPEWRAVVLVDPGSGALELVDGPVELPPKPVAGSGLVPVTMPSGAPLRVTIVDEVVQPPAIMFVM